MVNLRAIQTLVSMCRAQGGIPAELHFNKKTLDAIKAMVNAARPPQQDRRSLLARLREPALPPEKPKGMFMVCGLPAIENELCEDDCAALRPAESLNDPDWLRKIINPPEMPQHEAVAKTPWFEREKKTDSYDDKISSDMMIRPSGRPSPTDILIKAMTEADEMMDCIVIGVKNNGDVYMAASMPKIAAGGYLHKIITKLMVE